MLWADPDRYAYTDWANSERGISYVFSKNVVNNFLEKMNLDLIVRAHQVVEDGY